MSRGPADPIIDKNDPEFRGRCYTFGRPSLGAGIKKLDPVAYGMGASSSLSGYLISDAASPSHARFARSQR